MPVYINDRSAANNKGFSCSDDPFARGVLWKMLRRQHDSVKAFLNDPKVFADVFSEEHAFKHHYPVI